MPVFQPRLFLQYLLSFDYFSAALNTLWISLASLALGLFMGLILAIGQEARLRAVRAVVRFYLWLFRGTPALLQIVFAFNVLPSFGIVLPGYACAVLALGLNEGAYIAEIFRSGISAIPQGQREAARALGLTEWRIMRLIVLPQAIRIVVPAIGNQFISMLKLSALVSVIGVRELLLIADQAAASNFRYLEALAAAGIYYLLLTSLFTAAQHWIERLLDKEERTAAATATPDGDVAPIGPDAPREARRRVAAEAARTALR
jgi:polar amino acid transport system permease protein